MIDDLKSRLEEAFTNAEVAVAGEGSRFEIHIASAAFEGLNRVARQQAVYAVIGDLIASGAIHAVTIRASTLDEDR